MSYLDLLHANFNFLASLCSRGDWIRSYGCFLETPKTGFVVSKPISPGFVLVNLPVASIKRVKCEICDFVLVCNLHNLY